MKITYAFINETIEIDVDEDWGNTLIELNRQEYNINHKETRRHASLDAYNLDDALLPSEEDIELDFIKKLETEDIEKALSQLSTEQQKLIYKVFFNGESMSEIARQEKVKPQAIQGRVSRALKNLKNILK